LKFEVARQASSPSLCASVRAVPWADEAEQQLSRLALSACELSAHIRIFVAGCGGTRHGHRKIRLTFEVARQSSISSLCASVRAVPWADEAEQQLSGLAFPGCEVFVDVRIWEQAAGGARHGHPNLRMKFEVARQASSPSLCASVPAVPWADEPEQKLSRIALSACELSAEVHVLGVGLPEESGMDTKVTYEV